MGALLEDRVAAYLVDKPGSSFLEIQRAIPCLTKMLEEILANPLFTERDGRWRLGEETNGLSVSSPSGLVDGPPGRDDGSDRAAHQQLAMSGAGFRKQAAA